MMTFCKRFFPVAVSVVYLSVAIVAFSAGPAFGCETGSHGKGHMSSSDCGKAKCNCKYRKHSGKKNAPEKSSEKNSGESTSDKTS
jgi:hypothetical protein